MKNKTINWKIVAIVIFTLLILCIGIYLLISSFNIKNDTSISDEINLSSWVNNSKSKEELINYVEEITKENGNNYIPVENRIAVFDLDGTIFSETAPIAIYWDLFLYRILEDSDYKNIATNEQVNVATRIQEDIKKGKNPNFSSKASLREEAFKGMTVEDFENYVAKFLLLPSSSFNGITKKEEFFKPMLEVIKYLQNNDFTIYICSGTNRFMIRALIKDVIDIPENQVIGTDPLTTGGNNKSDMILTGNVGVMNTNINKVNSIKKEINKQPVLVFGNSSVDYDMAKFAISNNPYKSKAFMVVNDDTTRENGNISRNSNLYNICEKNGWTPISMKNDWKTIYGDTVTKK